MSAPGNVRPHGAQAAFFRAALLLGLLPGDLVVAWADAVLAHDHDGPEDAALIEIASTSPSDLTGLRLALLALCDEKESAEAVPGVLGLVGRDLASGRRNSHDTMTVLRQLRKFLVLDPALGDQLKSLSVDFAYASARPGGMADVERQIHAWLEPYRGAEQPFLRREMG